VTFGDNPAMRARQLVLDDADDELDDDDHEFYDDVDGDNDDEDDDEDDEDDGDEEDETWQVKLRDNSAKDRPRLDFRVPIA